MATTREYVLEWEMGTPKAAMGAALVCMGLVGGGCRGPGDRGPALSSSVAVMTAESAPLSTLLGMPQRLPDAAFESPQTASPDAARPPAALQAPPQPMRLTHFAWRPSGGPSTAYAMAPPEDQHRLAWIGAIQPGGAYPIVISLHGQPRRGENPRDYESPTVVLREVLELAQHGEVPPLILVLPVYRHEGQPWPAFELDEFRSEIERLLAVERITPRGYYVFGHSAAAGCGGRGLNGAARLRPSAVAFLDTCVGPGLRRAVQDLEEAKIPTLLMHSVETAGFSPRQATEYMTTFDFGQVYRPMGLRPIECPTERETPPLRDQAYRCAATRDGIVRALVIDTGSGEAGHNQALRVGLRYFLRRALRSP